MSTSSRRTFLKQVSAAAALGLVGSGPGRLLWATPLSEVLPEPDEALLRELALVSVDAARAAGASFADVRVAAGREIVIPTVARWSAGTGPGMGRLEITLRAEYGVRAVVDGAWGFASGFELTPDAARLAAQKAVARARDNRPRRPRTLALARVPVAETGEWSTPIEQDPFEVPIGDQVELGLAAIAETERVAGLDGAMVRLQWRRNIRVFASSEEGLIVQRVTIAMPLALAWAPGASESAAALRGGGYGYEAMTRVDLGEELHQAAERAVAESRRPPPVSGEVGRYDLVFGAGAVASLITTTIAEALNLERVLGYHANSSGTSFAAPPADIIDRYQVASPLLTIRADRRQPNAAATVGWDDEGVRTGEHTLVRDGVIVDYLTNRQTSIELADLYASRSETARSRGCAMGVGGQTPQVRLPNITMEPGSESLSVEDIISGTKRGFYIEGGSVTSDQQLLNTQGGSFARWTEIRDGQLGNRVRDLAFQFITPTFFRGMDAIGGAGSAVNTLRSVDSVGLSGDLLDPLQLPMASVRSVPARMRDVNVLSIGGTL